MSTFDEHVLSSAISGQIISGQCDVRDSRVPYPTVPCPEHLLQMGWRIMC